VIHARKLLQKRYLTTARPPWERSRSQPRERVFFGFDKVKWFALIKVALRCVETNAQRER